MTRRLKNEAGYSLVEVMVAIVILTIAIIPMVGMFDMGLTTANLGSNYDKARALANTNLDKVRALSYSDAIVTYEPVNAPPADATRTVSCDQDGFTCTVRTTFVNDSFIDDYPANKMRVEVTVEWEGNKRYTTTGLKAQ